MENNYNLKINTTQFVDGESIAMDFEMNASYVQIDGTRYISYIEKDDTLNTKLRTTVKIKESNTVTIIKGHGEGMILEEGKTHSCKYPTAYGIIFLDVYAHKIINNLNDNGGELELSYILSVEGAELSRNTLHLTVISTISEV